MLCRLVLCQGAVVAALHLGQFHHLGRHGVKVVGLIALTYQHIVHLQRGLCQCVFGLRQTVVQGKEVQLRQFLSLAYKGILCPAISVADEIITVFNEMHIAVGEQENFVCNFQKSLIVMIGNNDSHP